MIESRIGKRGAAALAMWACGLATAQPVGYDFNGDGYSDYPVSIISYDDTNPDVGAARIWSGASKAVIHTITGTDTNALFGWSTGSAGDLNGDGKDDLIVGEPLWSTPLGQSPTFQGRLKVFSGADASTLLTINGPYVDAAIGRYVTGIGDWDGDGTIDIASSGWDIADTDSDGIGDDPIGMVFIFSGDDGSLLTEIFDPASTSGFGYSVFSLGDITGNGKADIAVVDQHIETGSGTGIFGQLYIFEGSATETAYHLTDAYRTISNTDPTIRGYAAQVDVMHPDLWLDEPTLQILNLTDQGTGGVNEAQIEIDIMKTDGVLTGTKGTRSSLKLAGDINLDGKVDAADLQDSISQLGTDPQAIGVMPIADSNGDNIIDATDIQVVVNGYGATTDIYEGLWDGSRLLSIAAGSVGFGSTSGISVNPIGGGTQFGGGRRPVDDCLRSTTPPGWSGSIVPDLLRIEAAENCNSCPGCDDPDPRGCYECSQKGNVSGGEISMSPSQPKPGEAVTFTISPWQINGRKEKCKSSCGPEGTECDIDVSDRHPYWELEIKDVNGNWIVIDLGTSATVTLTGNACAEYRLELPERVLLGASGNCDELKTSQKEKEVQYADFILEIENQAATPANNKRTTIGVCEITKIEVVEGVSVSWEITVNGGPPISASGTSVTFQAPPVASSVNVKAISGVSCFRDETFTVIEPSGVVMNKIGEWHTNGSANSGFCANPQILPTSVSFTGIEIREGEATGVGSGSFAGGNGQVHPIGMWASIGENNTNPFVVDNIRSVADAPNPNPAGYMPGTFLWPIPWEYRCGGGPAKQFTVVNHFETIDASGTITMSKGGASSTHAVSDPTENCP